MAPKAAAFPAATKTGTAAAKGSNPPRCRRDRRFLRGAGLRRVFGMVNNERCVGRFLLFIN